MGAKVRINERKMKGKHCFSFILPSVSNFDDVRVTNKRAQSEQKNKLFCSLCRVSVTLMQPEPLVLYYVISLQSFSLIAQNKAIAAQTKASGHKKSRNFALLRIACQPDT
jgi:hypothetical protein